MQLKNNRTGSAQLFYWDKKSGKDSLEVIHIPAGATVEISDAIFTKLTASRTTVELQEEAVIELDTGASPIEMDRKKVSIKEYYATGKTKEINLLRESIRLGEYSIVEDVHISDEAMGKVLNENGISVKDMNPEQIKALYIKLA